MDWLKRGGRSLGDPSKSPWCGDFVETCIRRRLPDEPLPSEPLPGALRLSPYGARNWLLFGRETKPVIRYRLNSTRANCVQLVRAFTW